MQKEYDFSKARRAKDVSHLKKLKESSQGKTRITIMLDNEILESFRLQAEKEGSGYQTLINKALKSSLGKEPLSEERLRKVIREELSNQK
ncbi:MAG: hypothetical protein RLZZ385_250 [Pseudomonadota bacterium]|jgi:uncharacterized protein (DUF4415 family)